MKTKRKLFISVVMLLAGQFITYAQQSVEIVGHRGAAYYAPENTLASVRRAIEMGADAVEVDIHLSADHKLVVIHDKTTKRTTGADFVVSKTVYEELARLDAGSFKSAAFAGERIPLLSQVLNIIPDGIHLYIEIKGPAELLPVLVEELSGAALRKQCRIIAFDIETITEAKRLMPDIPCYYLKTIVPRFTYNKFVSELKERNLDGADLAYLTITRALVRKLNKANMPCLAWTVNSVEQAKKLVDMGVVGITTDRPDFIRTAL